VGQLLVGQLLPCSRTLAPRRAASAPSTGGACGSGQQQGVAGAAGGWQSTCSSTEHLGEPPVPAAAAAAGGSGSSSFGATRRAPNAGPAAPNAGGTQQGAAGPSALPDTQQHRGQSERRRQAAPRKLPWLLGVAGCWNMQCNESEPPSLVCSGCGLARYCSDDCHQLSWSVHRRQCKEWRRQQEQQQQREGAGA
jgi:hypothetical protein